MTQRRMNCAIEPVRVRRLACSYSAAKDALSCSALCAWKHRGTWIAPYLGDVIEALDREAVGLAIRETLALL